MNAPPDIRALRWLPVALASLLFVLGGTAVGFSRWHQRLLVREVELSGLFHGRSIELSERIRADYLLIERTLSGGAPFSAPFQNSSVTTRRVAAIHAAADSLVTLERRHAVDGRTRTLSRLVTATARLESAVSARPPGASPVSILRVGSAVLLHAEQLVQLHRNASTELRSASARRESLYNTSVLFALVFLGVPVALLALYIFQRILRLVGEHEGSLVRIHTESKRLAEAQRIGRMGHWNWKIDTDDLHWSDQIYRIFGLERRQFDETFEAFLKVVHPDDRDLVEGAVREALDEGVPYSIDHRIVLPDDEVRVVHAEAEVRRDNMGNAVRMAGTVQDVTDSRRVEEDLRDSLREKEVLLQEMHHRVKNNLQIVSSLLALQSERLKDNAARAALSQAQQRVRSMALVHDRLFRAMEGGSVDFEPYLEELVGHLVSSSRELHGPIETAVLCEVSEISVDLAIPCGLIVNELVSNAIEHAFPGKSPGCIRIEFHPGADLGPYRLIVADDGIGIPLDRDGLTTDTLGLRLVHILVGQIGGSLDINADGGTEFVITFPAFAPA